ncbi:MAG TPA: ImmA/IrrE family metallo-endopeptidase [Candidatus Saccharimonadales bacterium]|nr:ImmA/IrrE family metallo-endopeptidase [Candidatus Saccharimonadales bacterium]
MGQVNNYTEARVLAREVRAKYCLTSARVMVSDLRHMYRTEGIGRLDYWDKFKGTRLKGAYFNDQFGATVVINKRLINQIEPKVFTLAHELKHHLADEVVGVSFCSDDNEKVQLERAADAFASELIYPVSLFSKDMADRGIGQNNCTAEDLVHLKHTTKTTLSHSAIALRAARLGYCDIAILKTHWFKLRDELYPEYARYKRANTFSS